GTRSARRRCAAARAPSAAAAARRRARRAAAVAGGSGVRDRGRRRGPSPVSITRAARPRNGGRRRGGKPTARRPCLPPENESMRTLGAAGCLLLLTWSFAARAQEAAAPTPGTVKVRGTGPDDRTATENALVEAIRQVLGVTTDDETMTRKVTLIRGAL